MKAKFKNPAIFFVAIICVLSLIIFSNRPPKEPVFADISEVEALFTADNGIIAETISLDNKYIYLISLEDIEAFYFAAVFEEKGKWIIENQSLKTGIGNSKDKMARVTYTSGNYKLDFTIGFSQDAADILNFEKLKMKKSGKMYFSYEIK